MKRWINSPWPFFISLALGCLVAIAASVSFGLSQESAQPSRAAQADEVLK
ncbi:MAG: hypothetical protein F6J97_11005 [Leptolyngbya sp. SIO4C1]|nr:hypothetical protein [Leptolyngbya sp. SIO4C1]